MHPLASIPRLLSALAAADAPLVIVIDLPGAETPQEQAAPLDLSELPSAPKRPPTDAPERDWVTFREAERSWQAAKLSHEAQRQAKNDAEAAVRSAVRARQSADRRAASATGGIESGLNGLRAFRVLGARSTRRALGERTRDLVGCEKFEECIAPWANELGAQYVITVSALRDEEAVFASWILLDEAAVVLSHAKLEPGQSASTLVTTMYEPIRLGERNRALQSAERAAQTLDWEGARGWAERAILLDADSGAARFAAGRAAFEQGDIRGARRHLDTAIEREHELGEAHHLLGLIALRKSQAEAAPAFRAALDAGRESFEAHLTLAAVIADENEQSNAKAQVHLNRALELSPGHGEASFLLGELRWKSRQSQQARPLLEAAIRGGHRTGEAHHLLGQIATHEKRTADAVRHFAAGRDLGVTDAGALLVLARAWAPNNPGDAAVAYAEARRRGEQDAQIDLELGRAAFAAGDVTTARAALRRATHSEAHRGPANDQLGRMYLALGNLAVAARYFRDAVEARTDSYEARVALGSVSAAGGRSEEALEHFRAALERRPKDGPASLGTARALLALGREEQARPHLLRSAHAEHQPALAYELLATLETNAGDEAAALEHLRAAGKAGSDEPDVFRRLARRTRDDEALHHWQTVLELLPGDAEASFALGVEAHRSGALERAVALLTPLTRSRTWRAEAHQRLGQIAEQGGQSAIALAHFEKTARYRPADFALLVSLGRNARDAGQTDLAHGYLNRALAFRPVEGKLLLWLGEVELARKRLSQAQAYLGRALTAGYRPAEVHHALAIAALGLDDELTARTHFAAAAKGGIESARGELTLATAAADAKKIEIALTHLTAAARRARIDGNGELYAEAMGRGRELAKDPEAFEKRAGPPPTP